MVWGFSCYWEFPGDGDEQLAWSIPWVHAWPCCCSGSHDTRDEASRGWSWRGGKIISKEHSMVLILLQGACAAAERKDEY